MGCSTTYPQKRLGQKYCSRLCSKENGGWDHLSEPRWKDGDRKTDADGYVLVKRGSIWRHVHREVMEGILGRKLEPHESVHHRNGIRDDNRPENLELWLDGIRYGQRARDVACPHCGKGYFLEKT